MGIKKRSAKHKKNKRGKRMSAEILILKRVTQLKQLLIKKIVPQISFAHDISVKWKDGDFFLVIRAREKLRLEFKDKRVGKILFLFELVREFFADYSPNNEYNFVLSGRSNRHKGTLVFMPKISMVIGQEKDEVIVQRLSTALARLTEIKKEAD